VKHPAVLPNRHDGNEFKTLGKLHWSSKRHWSLDFDGVTVDTKNPSAEEKITPKPITATRRTNGEFDRTTAVTNLLQTMPPSGGTRALCRHRLLIPSNRVRLIVPEWSESASLEGK